MFREVVIHGLPRCCTSVDDLPGFFGPVEFLGRWLTDSEEPMRMSRFREEQMVAILRDADRTSVAEAARKNKVSERTIYV